MVLQAAVVCHGGGGGDDGDDGIEAGNEDEVVELEKVPGSHHC